MLAMWVPELPFQLACLREHRLRDRPLAFLSPQSGHTPSLWLVNRLAKAEGAVPGDPMDQALRHVPGLQVLEPVPQVWWEAQAHLGDFLSRWSPQGLLGRTGEATVALRGTSGLSQNATAARSPLTLSADGTGSGGGRDEVLAPHPLEQLLDLTPRIQWCFQRLCFRPFCDLQPIPLQTLTQILSEPDAKNRLVQTLERIDHASSCWRTCRGKTTRLKSKQLD